MLLEIFLAMLLAMIAGQELKLRQRRRLRQLAVFFGSCLLIYYFFFQTSDAVTDVVASLRSSSSPSSPSPPSTDIFQSLSLTSAQCRATFPGLFKPIDDMVKLGPFKIRQHSGPLQGKIKDGKIYIIHAERKVDFSKEMLASRSSTLHQLHRALTTSPEPLPDIVFSINIQDNPYGTAWCYSHHGDPALAVDPNRPNTRVFLMPHFSFWAWPLPFIEGIDRAESRIAGVEREYAAPYGSWADKISKAVWRGTPWFNSIYTPRLRQDLVVATRGKEWADAIALGGKTGNTSSDVLRIEDFCRYKYVLHTEGITYSGRLQYHQMCKSVLITAVMYWPQHTTHLVKPVFPSAMGIASSARWETAELVQRSWPVAYSPQEANAIFVSADWTDLEQVIMWLEDHPDIAEGIAQRQRDFFVGGGYFSPAAEVCYWRELVRGWGEVADPEGEGWDELPGTRFEYWGLDGGW